MKTKTNQFPPLVEVNRPNLTTNEAAYYFNRKPQTLRAWACLKNGPIKPERINGRLIWPTQKVKKLLGVA
jgi:hypothetical protein